MDTHRLPEATAIRCCRPADAPDPGDVEPCEFQPATRIARTFVRGDWWRTEGGTNVRVIEPTRHGVIVRAVADDRDREATFRQTVRWSYLEV